MKALIFVFVLAFVTMAQQVNSTWGLKATSGDAWTGAGVTYIDTTTTTGGTDIIVDIDDFYNAYADSVVGTLYTYWDNQGTGSPTTDSLLYTIKGYPGIYTTNSKSVAGLKYGSSVQLDSVVGVNDTYVITDVFISAINGEAQLIPPDVIKLELKPVGNKNCDDSTKVNWVFRYPAIYQDHKEQK